MINPMKSMAIIGASALALGTGAWSYETLAQSGTPSQQPGPSNPQPRPSNPQPGPSNPQPRPTNPDNSVPQPPAPPVNPNDPNNPNPNDPNRPVDPRAVDPNQPGVSAGDRYLRPFAFQSPEMESRFRDSTRRLVAMEQRLEKGNQDLMKRLGDVRSMPADRQNAALLDVLQQVLIQHQTMQQYLVAARTGWSGDFDMATADMKRTPNGNNTTGITAVQDNTNSSNSTGAPTDNNPNTNNPRR